MQKSKSSVNVNLHHRHIDIARRKDTPQLVAQSCTAIKRRRAKRKIPAARRNYLSRRACARARAARGALWSSRKLSPRCSRRAPEHLYIYARANYAVSRTEIGIARSRARARRALNPRSLLHFSSRGPDMKALRAGANNEAFFALIAPARARGFVDARCEILHAR